MTINDARFERAIAEMKALAAYDEERYQVEKRANALDKCVSSDPALRLFVFQTLYNQLTVDERAALYDKVSDFIGGDL